MKHQIIISTIAVLAVCPAFADIALNNDNPTCDSSTIGASSGSTSLDAVWNIVNQTCAPGQYFDMTTATCVTCTANSYCPGGTYNVESQTNGLNSCPNGYGLSATGADAQTDCYRTCTTNDVAHSTGVTGGYYYGDNNQCAATNCETGYSVKAFNLATAFGEAVQTSDGTSTRAQIDTSSAYSEDTWDNGTSKPRSYYGISANNEWSVSLDDYSFGVVKGQGRCSTEPGRNGWNGGGWNTITTFANLEDKTGQSGAQYCYCTVLGYKAPGSEEFINLTPSWVYRHDFGSGANCAENCVYGCSYSVQAHPVFRTALFAAVQPSLAKCEANTINITWYNEGEIHDENTCTYSQSVTLPETDPQRTGYTFTGWTVRPTATPAQVE